MLAVQGPKSDEVLAALGLPDRSRLHVLRGDPLRRARTSSSAAPATPASAATSWSPPTRWRRRCGTRCSRRGRRTGCCPCGLGARDTLRTEMGYPLHGQDISLEVTPVQARLGWAVGWKKPAFWGKEPLLAEKEAGVRGDPARPGRPGARDRPPADERQAHRATCRSATSPRARSPRPCARASPWR